MATNASIDPAAPSELRHEERDQRNEICVTMIDSIRWNLVSICDTLKAQSVALTSTTGQAEAFLLIFKVKYESKAFSDSLTRSRSNGIHCSVAGK